MPNLDIPGAGVIAFPDDMPKEQIRDIVENRILPKVRQKMPFGGQQLPPETGTINANLPPPVTSGPEGPMLAALVLSQIGPVIASQMKPGVGKALIEQVNAQNVAMAALGPELLTSKLLGIPIRAVLAARGAKQLRQGLGAALVDQPGGQRRYDLTQAAFGGAQIFAAPKVPEAVGSLFSKLVPQKPAPVIRPGMPGYIEAINKTLPKREPVQAAPAAAQAAPPSSFDKGKVLPNETAVPTKGALQAEVAQIPTEQLAQRYAGTQAVAKMLLAQGRLQEASVLITRGQFMREELARRTSESSRLPVVKPASVTSQGAAPTPAAPLTFSPAVKRGDVIYTGEDHGAITAKILRADQEAKKAGVKPLPKPERGYIGSDGKFYAILETTRAKMQKPGVQAPQPKVENVPNQSEVQQSGGPKEEVAAPAPQSNVQKEVPPDVEQGLRGTPGSNEPRPAGRVEPEKKSGLLSNLNGGEEAKYPISYRNGKKVDALGRVVDKDNKTTGESGFVIFPGKISGLESLGFKGGEKVAGDQFYNRIRNSLGAESGEFKYWDAAGLKAFLAATRTPQEVQQWMEEHGPKVEVRKFGEGGQTPEVRELNSLQHWFETNHKGKILYNDGTLQSGNRIAAPKDVIGQQEIMGSIENYDKLKRLSQLSNDQKVLTSSEDAHWSSIAPKSEQDMPGYVEIVVVKPVSDAAKEAHLKGRLPYSQIKFPSTHNYPPNTLVFVRAYIETDKATGEKTFHVIEVQSDWAQQRREYETTGNKGGGSPPPDPLLAHYERLALKAAIEHARAEGATRIAVSDAETAMMTEGHDLAGVDTDGSLIGSYPTREQAYAAKERMDDATEHYHTEREYVIKQNGSRWEVHRTLSKIPQEQGMRLHYDQTLPKILGELTGEKGQRVEFGEHRMAMQTGIGPRGEQRAGTVPRDDLIFQENGQPKTTITARSFPLTNTRKEFSMFGSDKAQKPTPKFTSKTGAVQVPKHVVDALADFYDRTKQVGADLKSFFDDMSGEGGRALMNTLRGKDLPRTAAADKDVANRLYTYAQANAISDVLAHTDPTEVLGSHWNDPVFDKKLGNVLVEYNLRQTGNTSIGKPWSMFKTEADYDKAIHDPEILAAIHRHADIVLKPAEERHTVLGGKLIELPAREAFINLKYVPKAEGGMKAASGGLLKATLQRKTRFSQTRAGTADEYETSYRKIAERMVKGNYSEDLRQKLNDSYVAKGLGVYVKPGDTIPKGMQEVPVRIQRAIIVSEGEGAPTIVNQNKSLYIKKELMPEYLQAMQANIKTTSGGLRKVAEVLTKLQVSLGVDAIQHTVNMASAVNGAVRASIGRNIIGVKELDTIGRIGKNVSQVLQDSPEVQHLLGEMAREYGIAREHKSYEGLFGGKSWGGAAIRTIDQAGRVTLFQLAKQLADAGLIKNDPVVIREFVNKQLGQYNARLMSSFNQFAKSTFAPFIVAGKTFNRLASTRLLLSPQIKAASPQTWALMRARQAMYVATAVVLVPAVVNYALTGSVFGGPDTRFGEIDLGDKGRFDMAKWTLLRRGARITGVQTMAEQQVMPRLRGEEPASLGQTARQVFTDVGRGQLAPYAGPPVNALATLATGKSALGYEARQPGETYPYVKAAGRQLNPLLGSTMDTAQGPKASLVKRGEQLVGFRDSNELSVIRQLARQFNYKQGKASETDFPPSEYVPLLNALKQGNIVEAKTLTDALVKEKKEKVVEQYFKNLPDRRFTGNKEREQEFVKTLTPHQLDLYNKAKAQNAETARVFFEQVLGKPVPAKGRSPFGSFSLGHF